MVAYRGKSPKIRAFFKMLVYRDGRHQIGVKWHISAYAGISWHIFPCKSGKKSGKVRGRTTGEQTYKQIYRDRIKVPLNYSFQISYVLY